MGRDLIAVLSPSKMEDSAEIVMAEGSVWVATTRSDGNTLSYEFTSVDPMGRTTTARWVRKQVLSHSLPSTPTSPGPIPGRPKLPETKFTFSMIDPRCRRHPILATLTKSSLDIHDTYTAASQSVNGYSPSSAPDSPSCGLHSTTERRTQPVQEWQKSFISVSAIWVALRYGWVPNFRPGDFMPARQTVDGESQGCQRSLSTSVNPMATPVPFETVGRCERPNPTRATSTGATFVQRKREMQQESDGSSADSEQNRILKLNRRAFSGDWSVGLLKSTREESLVEETLGAPCAPPNKDSDTHRVTAKAPSGRGPGSASCPTNPLQHYPHDYDAVELHKTPIGATQTSLQRNIGKETSPRRKSRKWKSMTNWFRKLVER